MNTQISNRGKTLFMAQFALMMAIEAIFCFTPLGSLPIAPPTVVATLMMIPVAITAAALGTKAGTIMGLISGIFSLIVWTFMPPAASVAVAFIFTPFAPGGNFFSLLICLLPRIIGGYLAGIVANNPCDRFIKKDWLRYALSGLAASLANTIFVLGGMACFFAPAIEAKFGMGIMPFLIGIILANSIAEAVVLTIITPAVCKPLSILIKKINR